MIVGEYCDERHRYHLANEYPGVGWLTMPADFVAVSSGKRRAQAEIAVTVVLGWIIIGLIMLVLLFADQSFSKATIELMCVF